MTRTFPDWAYLIDESGRHWYHLGKGTALAAGSEGKERPPQKALYAIPSRDLISRPHWVSSKEETLIARVVAVENEKLGVKLSAGPGRITDWRPVEYNGTRTLVQSVAMPWHFELPPGRTTEFTDFVPHYSLFPPEPNAVMLWQEEGEWVAGYARERRWVHVQLLGSLSAPDVAAEIQLTLMELSARGILEKTTEAVVWGNYDLALHQSLQENAGLEVRFEARPAPRTDDSAAWKLEPHEVSRAKQNRARQKRTGWIALFATVFLLLLVGAGYFHLWTLQQSNERLRGKIAANRAAADLIAEAMNHWESLSPVIEPRRAPVEIFHQISTLLPPKGFRLTRFEIQDYRIISLSGEASNMGTALKFKGDLENSEGLADFAWEESQPRQKGDLIEYNVTGTYLFQNETE